MDIKNKDLQEEKEENNDFQEDNLEQGAKDVQQMSSDGTQPDVQEETNAKDESQKDLLKNLGLEDLPEDKQEELMGKMGELLIKRIFLAIVDRLDEESRTHFAKMIEEERTPQEIEEFIKIKVENYEEVVANIVEEVEKELKEAGGDSK